jgi:hypothetical protein
VACQAVFVEGKTAKLKLAEEIDIDSIISLVSTGKDDFSNAEVQRRRLLTRALQNGEQLMDIPFVQMIWFPSIGIEQIAWPVSTRDKLDEPLDLEFDKDLNDSQARVFSTSKLVSRRVLAALVGEGCRTRSQPRWRNGSHHDDHRPAGHWFV